MKKTENYIQDIIILMVTAIISLFTSDMPYLCLFLSGGAIIALTIRNLSENELPMDILNILTVLPLSFFSGSLIGFLTLCSCRILKPARILLPPLFYIIYKVFFASGAIAETILKALILCAGALLICLIEKLILSYFTALERVSNSMSVTAVNEMMQRNLNHELIIKNYLADKNARLEERENISRNIHNSVGHTITAAIMTLDAADMLFESSPEKAKEKMNIANSRIRESLSSIRHAVRVLDNESKFVYVEDLIKELDDIVNNFAMDTNIIIRTDYTDISADLHIPNNHNEFLCGAVQELLSNGVCHGGADHFKISLSAYHGNICLKVSDNGKSSFNSENSELLIKKGFGLKKLISYAERCAGSAEFKNDNGFKATIKLPIYEEDI